MASRYPTGSSLVEGGRANAVRAWLLLADAIPTQSRGLPPERSGQPGLCEHMSLDGAQQVGVTLGQLQVPQMWLVSGVQCDFAARKALVQIT